MANAHDEIGYALERFEFPILYQKRGTTFPATTFIRGEDAEYGIHYHVTVGQPKSRKMKAPAVASVALPAWAGSYSMHVNGEVYSVTLTHEAEPASHTLIDGRAMPFGRYVGTATKNGSKYVVSTWRLWGNQWEFDLVKAGAKSQHFAGYLIGNAKSPMIAGTAMSGDKQTSFVMERK